MKNANNAPINNTPTTAAATLIPILAAFERLEPVDCAGSASEESVAVDELRGESEPTGLGNSKSWV